MIQTRWAELLLASLHQAGVVDAIISPGSRSTPFAAAALAAGMRCRAIIDERVAGFFAIGQARVSGRPSLLICSSGSAGAHYFPALIEAAHSSLPVIILTADRPPELHHCAAPQTTDQTRLFGNHARAFFDLGRADDDPSALRGLRRKAAQAVAIACGDHPGPVHLNAAARKPLEPAVGDAALATHRADPITRHFAPLTSASDAAIASLADACRSSCRGVIIAGPAPPARRRARADLLAIAAATGFPLVAEAASQLRFAAPPTPHACAALDLILHSPEARQRLQPELIVALDAPPTAAAIADYASSAARRFLVCERGWPDPSGRATAIVSGDVTATIRRLRAELATTPPQPDPAWMAAFAQAERATWSLVEAELVDRGAPLGEGQAVRATVAALPEDALLVVANGMAIRMVDTYCPGSLCRATVLSQRGVNGIDGMVAGAAGAASVSDRPVVAILGDVGFAHDIGALASARDCAAPLALVVIDNHGGRIFERLPVATSAAIDADTFARFWLTPPACDLAAAAALYGHDYIAVTRPRELGAALTRALGHPGCTLIHADVDPQSGIDGHHRLVRSVSTELKEGLS